MRTLILTIAAACAATPRVSTAPEGRARVVLYRNRTVIEQRIEVAIPSSGVASVPIEVAHGTAIDAIAVAETHGGLVIESIRGVTETASDPPETADVDEVDRDEEEDDDGGAADEPEPRPMVATLIVRGPPGTTGWVWIAYPTQRLRWEVRYSMTAARARGEVALSGALSIENRTGRSYPGTRVVLVDADLESWRGRAAERLATSLIGRSPGTNPLVKPLEVGTTTLGRGQTRLELLSPDRVRRARSVLVYDPIGTHHDHAGPRPVTDPELGMVPPPGSTLTESFELRRERETSSSLPGGPVRILEQDDAGELTLIGESRLFDAATRVARTDTVAVGIARDVIGRRERRDLSVDIHGKRVVEEVVLTVENERATAIDVILREHLYRGQNWSLAYYTGEVPTKDGPQQISFRRTVPARGTARLLYVVVYTGL